MIAIVTSCIKPIKTVSNSIRSFVEIQDRISQTQETIKSLINKGFKSIILVDNSIGYNFEDFKNYKELKIINVSQFQFHNKGINELLMLLTIIDKLPESQKIFKISGRYKVNEQFEANIADEYDFKCKAYDFKSKNGCISTRGYFVKSKDIYQTFLLECLNEVYNYHLRIVGLGSFLNYIKQLIKPVMKNNINLPIEFAAARVLKFGKLNYQLVENIGVEGEIAGIQNKTFIKE